MLFRSQGLVNDVKKYVSDAGIKAEIYGRAKHFFSIYKKMVNQDPGVKLNVVKLMA